MARPNGDDARETLSEGEKTFVTFLYFYYLLKGSTSETGVATDRIVVFDDPVSSLDSDVLFIVSSLMKEVCNDARQGLGQIKQVFVLTHNVYFHKEVTYCKRPAGGALKSESFWIVRKVGQQSKVERHASNPVKTGYELLWMQVRTADLNNPAIENTLRRILENYFTIFGSVDTDEICGMFEGQELLICRSLFSWVHAGSHTVYDDLYIAPSETMVQSYLDVFRKIFEKTKHEAHYNMMMRDESENNRSSKAVGQTAGVPMKA